MGIPQIKWQRLEPQTIDLFSHRPIFIIGSPRTGTTLMRQIINAYPAIFCPYLETFLFNTMQTTFFGHIWQYQYSQCGISRGDLIQWLRDFILQLFGNYGVIAKKKRWAEKTPSHAQSMDLIHETFPDGQFIHMVRNGIDVCISLKKQAWSKNMIQNVRWWVDNTRMAQRYASERLDESNYIEIRYESLLNNSEKELKRLSTYLDEAWTPNLLHFYKPENNTWGQKHGPIAHGKQRMDELTKKEMNIFRELEGGLMEELGYVIE